MKPVRRRIAAALLAAMLLPAFAACSEKQTQTQGSTQNASNNASGEGASEETKDYIETRFAGVDFGGAGYNIMTRAGAAAHDVMPRFDHEEITGEPVDDAIYSQVETVQDKLNVKITYEPTNDVELTLINGASAGDNSYALVIHSNQGLANLVTRNLFLDLNKLEEIDFTQPWWNKSYKDKLTIAGKTYCGFGDLFFEAAINNVHLMYFNKDKCNDYNIPYPYQAVYDGKWTMDYLMSMVQGVHQDLNGDGIYDEHDEWGLVQSPIQSAVMYYTAGFSTMSFDEEGYPYLDMYSEAFVNFYDKLYQLDYKTDEIWTNTQEQEDANFQMFVNGNVLLSSHFLTVTPTLRAVEFEVGILPYPKYEESADYVNWPTGGNFLLAVPSVNDPDDYTFIGSVTEALASQGHRFVRPALYNVTLQGKLARDPESADMLDLIFDTMSVDFGWIHNGDGGTGWFVNTCLMAKLANITSFYQKIENRAAKYYQGIVDFYRSID